MANIKLASVASDVFGVSGRRMLRARLDGVSTPQEMAELAKGTLRKKMAALAAALEGRVEDHHRFLLGMQLDRLEQVETAAVVLAELGVDMGVFPTVHHAAAWAGVCPGNNESAGKRKVNRGAKVTFIGPPHSYKLPYVRRERRAAISGKSTGASKHVAGPCERHWRSPTRSWWPLITCFATDWTTPISARVTSTGRLIQ